MTQSCEHVQQLLSEYYRGELKVSQVERVNQHMETCSQCQEAYRDTVHLEKLASSARITHRRMLEQDPDTNLGPHLSYEQMLAFSERVLSTTERKVVLTHIDRCAHCAHELMLTHQARLATVESTPKQLASWSWWQRVTDIPNIRFETPNWAWGAAALTVLAILTLWIGLTQFSSSDWHSSVQTALTDIRAQRYEEAQRLLTSLPSDVVSRSEVQFQLGMTYQLAYASSLSEWQLQISPERTLDVSGLTRIPSNPRSAETAQQEMLQQAGLHYRKALEEDSASAKAIVALALVHLRQGDLAQAQSIMESVDTTSIRQSPAYLNAHGVLLLRQGDVRKAATAFEEAITRAEVAGQSYLDPYFNRALAYTNLNEVDALQKAKQAWEEYLELDRNQDYWSEQARRHHQSVCKQLSMAACMDTTDIPDLVYGVVGIQLGDSIEDVQESLGKPKAKKTIEGQKLWHYADRCLDLEFRSGRVSRIVLLPRSKATLYGLQVGSLIESARATLGLPSRIYSSDSDSQWWHYPYRGLSLEVKDGEIHQMELAG